MTTLLEIRDAALRLSPTEREQLSYDLIVSLQSDTSDDSEWERTIQGRIDDLDSGREAAQPWEALRAELWRGVEVGR